MFDSIDEKRFYVQDRLPEGERGVFLCALRQGVYPKTQASAILRAPVPMDGLGSGESPFAPTYAACGFCGIAFKQPRTRPFCSTHCRWQLWEKEKRLEGMYP
jgi:hypothetical protein